jgi:hypothetical protein
MKARITAECNETEGLGFKPEGLGFKPHKSQPYFSFFLSFNSLCISQIPSGKKKVFNFKNMIIIRIYWLKMQN